jgi:iron transport multicopper oxidase
LALIFVVAPLAAVVAPLTSGHADVLTNSNDTGRDGWYPNEAALSPATVTGGQFGQLFSSAVDGQVYAQPVVSQGTLLVATENNNVYGLDPQTGAKKWTRALGPAFNPNDIGCADLSPSVGVTGTPVVDPATDIAYFLDKQYVSGASGTPEYVAQAVHVNTGAEVAGWPIKIQGYADNAPHDSSHLFDPTEQLQRPGLLLMDGVVYAAFGSSCDGFPWMGWIVGLSTTTHSITTMFTAVRDDTSGAGIWQAGSGLVSDGDGQILFSTGNGGFDLNGPTPGNQPPNDLSEAVARVQVQPDGTLKATDFFAPYDAPALENNDLDFGSGGPVVLPDQYFGVGTNHPHLLVMEGKQGYVYLLDRDNLGGYLQGPSGGDGVVDRIGPYGGVWSRPAVWPGDGGYVYFVTANGSGGQGLGGSGFLRAYKYGVDGSGNPTLSLAASSSTTFGFGSGAPAISSNGTASGSGLLWVVWEKDGNGVGAQLRAYDPVPVNGQFTLRWSAPIGTASKFSMPVIDNAHVYVGTRDGHVLAFWSPVDSALSASAPDFPATILGQSATESVVFTARHATTVNDFSSTDSSFKVGAPSPAVPVDLQTGDSVSVPLTFTPSTTGLASTTLHVDTSGGGVDIPVSAAGVLNSPQLVVSPTQLSLGGTTGGGTQLSGAVTITNGGGQPMQIDNTDLPAPSSPFTVSGVPQPGTIVAPGDSIALTATFTAPNGAVAGHYHDTLTLHTDDGEQQTVEMTAVVAAPAHVTITPTTFNLGNVPLGATIDSKFVLHNSGGLSASFVRSKPPARNVGFQARTTLSEGTSLPAGGTLTETVRFSATKLGTFTDAWSLNPADGQGLRTVTFTAHVVASPAHGYWMLGSNGAVYPFGSAKQYGSVADPNVAHLTPTKTALGYWVVNHAGQVYAFGDAHWYGNTGPLLPGELVTTMSATATGKGYWVFTSAGRVFTFGDAKFYGDLRQVRLNGPVIDSVPTASGHGYYLVASDGGVFAFGDARFHGSLGSKPLNKPVIGLVPTATGNGYWLDASDGGVFAFGGAPFRGSLGAIQLNRPVVGMVRFGNGYLVAASDGGVFDFSSSPFLGSLGDRVPASPIIGLAAFDR